MSLETIAPILVEQSAEVSRRTLLRVALLGGGAVLAPVLVACGGEPSESPSGGHPSVYTPPSEVTGQHNLPTPDASPSFDVAGTQTTEASPTASPTAERIKPNIEGHRLNDLKRVTWKSTENLDLADDIRSAGKFVEKDPSTVGTDPDYYTRAIVLGVPADKAKGKTVRLAITLRDPSQPAGDEVAYMTLPKGTVNVGGQQVSLMPSPTTSARVHPYRFRLGPADLSVAFMTSPDKETWTVVAPHIITPSTAVGNGTYSNAHVI